MFKKKPNVKPLSPLRSSDRRKLADQIISELGLHAPINTSDDATAEEKSEATTKLTSLRNSILPDNAQSARFTTTHGPDLKLVSGTIYIGAYEGSDLRVLWVKVAEQLWPTVYTLWRNPRLVPLLHTPQLVVTKLQSGADLMTPGLADRPPFPAKAKKGAIVAVASLDSPSVPVAVGRCEIDISSLQQVQGAKGVAVQTLQWAGDELWAWSPSAKPGLDPPKNIDEWLRQKSDEVEQAAGSLEGVNLKDEDDKAPPEASSSREANGDSSVDHKPEEKTWTIQEIDDAFFQALLFSLHQHKQAGSPPRYGLDFPLKPSFIASNLIQPHLPIFTPADAEALQIKKTSWKNMKKFLKHLDKLKPAFCATKEQGGETIINVLEFDHPEIEEFKPYPLPRKSKETGSKGGKMPEPGSDVDSSIGQTLKIIPLYKVKDKLTPLFGEHDAKGYHTAAEIKEGLSQYIEREELISATNKRLVKLDPFLSNTVLDGSKPTDRDAHARRTIPRDALLDRVLSHCSSYHIILRNTSTPDSSTKPRAGAPPKITIMLETRSGSKTVTKVSGLEAFHILPQPLADELRKTCAGSTSVDQLVGSSPKNPVMEVMIQGPQSQTVLAALEKRGIDKRWVDVVDKTKKKK